MALFNYAGRELTLKIVYYGPGLSGKTTNLAHIHSTMPQKNAGKMLSLSTETDRTLFFDFLPVAFKKSKDFTVRFQLYTVPGQVRYNATRKLVLKGADAVVFVADSQKEMRDYNVESLQNMRENMKANNLDPKDVPIVLQYNKRDLSNILSTEELDADLNAQRWPAVVASAISGAGVKETFQTIARMLLKGIRQKHGLDIGFDFEPEEEKPGIKTQPVPAQPPKSAPQPVQAMAVDSISRDIFYGQTETPDDLTEPAPGPGKQPGAPVEKAVEKPATQIAEAELKKTVSPPVEKAVEKPAPPTAVEMQPAPPVAEEPATKPAPSTPEVKQADAPHKADSDGSPNHLEKATQNISFAVFDASVHMKNSNDAILRSLAILSDSIKTIAGELDELKRRHNAIEEALKKNPTG